MTFHASRGWINDPHGLTWHDGRYHLFFQHVPDSTTWRADVRWGHATGPDLVTWTEHEPALEPEDGEVGCWSGCLVAGSPPTIFYTSVVLGSLDLGRVRSAVPLDEGWSRWRRTSLVIEPPPGLVAFRDPCVVRENDGWRMVVGAGLSNGVPAVVSFTSPDLLAWRYDGVLDDEPPGPGDVWECPQLLAVDGHRVLIVSVQERGEAQHVMARVDDGEWHRLTYGSEYASSVFRDEHGRPGLVSWLRDAVDMGGQWAGAISDPQLLRVVDGRLALAAWTA